MRACVNTFTLSKSDLEQNDRDRIFEKMLTLVRSDAKRPIAIHEAGHAVVALHLGLPIELVDIEEHESADGPTMGRLKMSSVRKTFRRAKLLNDLST